MLRWTHAEHPTSHHRPALYCIYPRAIGVRRHAAHPYTDAYAASRTDLYANANARANADARTNGYTHSDPHANPHRYAHGVARCQPNQHADTPSNVNAYRGRSSRGAHRRNRSLVQRPA